MENRISELRHNMGISRRKLGLETNIPEATLRRYEANTTEPKLDTWNKLSNFFGVPVEYLQGYGMSREQFIQYLGIALSKSERVRDFFLLYLEGCENFSENDIKDIKEKSEEFENQEKLLPILEKISLTKDYAFLSNLKSIRNSRTHTFNLDKFVFEVSSKLEDEIISHTPEEKYDKVEPKYIELTENDYKLHDVLSKLSIDDLNNILSYIEKNGVGSFKNEIRSIIWTREVAQKIAVINEAPKYIAQVMADKDELLKQIAKIPAINKRLKNTENDDTNPNNQT